MMIWLHQTGEALPIRPGVRKMRTALLANRLVDRGHHVVWWASAFDHMSKRMLFREDIELPIRPGLTIHALRGIPYSRNITLTRYLDHRLVAEKFRRRAPGLPRPDVIVSAMPDYHLAYEAAQFARKKRIPILIDIRDQWPDIFLQVIPPSFRGIARALLFDDFRKLRRTLTQADALISMMDPLLDWGLARVGRSATWKDRVFYLGATRPKTDGAHPPGGRLTEILERSKNKFIVVFIGTFGSYANPLTIVRAAQLLNQSTGPNSPFVFIVAGDGEHFEDVTHAARNESNIFFPGWVREEEIAVLLSAASVGVIPSNQPVNAFPNKAFVYLSAGLPILASVEGDLKHYIDQREIGMHFPPNDHVRLAEHVRTLADHPRLRQDLAKNSRTLFNEKLDADTIYTSYADHIEKVVSANRDARS